MFHFTLLLIGCMALAWGLVALFHRYAPAWRLLDIPNARSSHRHPTPRGAGIAFIVPFLLGLLLLQHWQLISLSLWLALTGGGLLIAADSFLDDLRHISATTRLITHTIAAALLFWLFHGMPPMDLGFFTWHWHWLGILTGLFGVVWMINFYNFMDGLDGLASGQTLFICCGIALVLIWQGHLSTIWPFLLLAACLLGFLPWNWPPAKVFMGDTGSCFLGYCFAALLIYTLAQHTLSIWIWVILLACFWIDATLTLLRRILHREKWYVAHHTHAFQHAMKRFGGYHKTIVLTIMLINVLWLFPLALLAASYPNLGFGLTLIALAPLFYCWLRLRGGLNVEHHHRHDKNNT